MSKISNTDIHSSIVEGVKNGFSLYLYEEDVCRFGGILGFEKKQINDLLSDGCLKENIWKDEVFNDDPFREGLSLVISVDVQENLWDDEAPESITPFIKGCFLAKYDATEGLVLVSKTNLHDLLLQHEERYLSGKMRNILELKNQRSNLHIKATTAQYLSKQSDFSGRCHVCDFEQSGRRCDIPLCYSSFAWIRNGKALFYMQTGGDFITAVWIYAFKTIE